MDIPTRHPSALKPGDCIRVIAPAGPIASPDALNQGIATLERLGFRVRCDARVLASARYLAGDDSARAEELMSSFEDPAVAAIVAARGGYGCSRLIPLLDESRLRPNCKLFMGFSDLTTLHLHFRRRFGWVTIHGPMITSAALGAAPPDQEKHLVALLGDPAYRPRLAFPRLEAWQPGTAEGKLVGGCLSMVAASVGTPYEIRTDGKILFLEDQGEEPYRLDRMITQLRLAGKLDNLAGILLGSFNDCEPESGSYTSEEVLKDLVSDLAVPALARFPAGHGADNWALPIGAEVRLDADGHNLQFLEAAVS